MFVGECSYSELHATFLPITVYICALAHVARCGFIAKRHRITMLQLQDEVFRVSFRNEVIAITTDLARPENNKQSLALS
jgi:hypothetical protein